MPFTFAQFKAVLQGAHNPELKKESMVYQFWEDGEITLQKGGDLLWQRTLHSIKPGNPAIRIPPEEMPEVDLPDGKHGYAWVTDEDARILRDMLEQCEDRPKYVEEKYFNDGPLTLRMANTEDEALRLRDFLLKEFPMARDGKLEAIHTNQLPKDDYWYGKNVWIIRFPSGHDHWLSFKTTYDKMNNAAGDYEHGYQVGYKQGLRDADHQRYLEMSKKEQIELRMRPATPGAILDEVGDRKTFYLSTDARMVKKDLAKKNIKATVKEIQEVVEDHASRGWIKIIVV